MLSRNLVVATLYVLSFLLEPSFGAKGPLPPIKGGLETKTRSESYLLGPGFGAKEPRARYPRSSGASN